MTLFILTIDEVFDFEGFKHKPRAFTDEKKALDALDEAYQCAKKENPDWSSDEYKKGDSCFSLYPDAEWGTSHFDGCVNEVEVEQ